MKVYCIDAARVVTESKLVDCNVPCTLQSKPHCTNTNLCTAVYYNNKISISYLRSTAVQPLVTYLQSLARHLGISHSGIFTKWDFYMLDSLTNVHTPVSEH